MEKTSLERIISQLTNFLIVETTPPSNNFRRDRTAFHYYTEIIRYWSKLNFVLNYTTRALNLKDGLRPSIKSEYLFIIYRYYWEDASLKDLITDLKPLRSMERKLLKAHQIKNFFNKLQTFSWNKAFSNKSKLEKLSIDQAIPSFFIKKLLPYMSEDFLIKNIEAMNNYEKMETSITPITAKSSSGVNLGDIVVEYLENANIPFKKDSKIHSLIHIHVKYISSILKSDFYKNGQLLILDKGSVYIANLLLERTRGRLLDMCGAPGIKTLYLADNLENRNRLIAADFNLERVMEMKELLSFYDFSRISILNTDGIDFPVREENYFNKILLDAPCTGSGTFSSNPELKWRQNSSFLHQNVILQEKLLKSAIEMLKPKGTLIYSSCSLYAQEGEMQIQKFLDELDPIILPDIFSPSYKLKGRSIPGTGRLFPADNNSKGFFVGKFKKKA